MPAADTETTGGDADIDAWNSSDQAHLHGRARVWCESCGFNWYGVIAAHGLSVLGTCPRCRGHLHFRDGQGDATAAPVEAIAQAAELQPWQVLGRPSTWSRH